MSRLQIDTKHLELVRALAENGSLSGAARALNFSQPAISQQVRALETRLKTEIIVRGRRGVELTEAGKILLRHGSSVLDTLMLAEAELAAAAGRRASNIRVTAFPSAAATIVATAMAQMAQENPNASFTLIEAEPPDALELLERGECDIAGVFRCATDASGTNGAVRWIPPREEGVQVAIPGHHPSIEEDEIDLTTLRDSPWIAGCPDCRGHLTQACKEAGFVPEIAFETHDYVALQNLAARGLGVALLPDLVLDAVQVDGLRIKPLRSEEHTSELQSRAQLVSRLLR